MEQICLFSNKKFKIVLQFILNLYCIKTDFFLIGDNSFTFDLTRHLFQEAGKLFGVDLVAVNIQRGRDHGLPSYPNWRKVCGLSPVNNFADLDSIMNKRTAQAMRTVYSNVNDIDLFIGASSEKRLRGALLGPTSSCIIAEQFRRLKKGDRFWFENGDLDTSFSRNQLKQLRKSSLARVLCDNSDVKVMQPLAMVQQFS